MLSTCGQLDDTISVLICVLSFGCFSNKPQYLSFICIMSMHSVAARSHMCSGKRKYTSLNDRMYLYSTHLVAMFSSKFINVVEVVGWCDGPR